MLLSRVDKTTRQRWLQAAKDKDSAYYPLYNDWMVWNPEDALQACVAADDPELLLEAAEVTAYTVSNAYNMSHWGLGVIRDFDLKTAAAKWMKPDGGIGEWGYQIMERWYAIDIGEAARYGFHFLTVQWPDYMPREDLIKMFSGDPECCSDSDMIDRTLCCMRFWAMWKPNEMRKWIETVKEADMRKALTWTLENPWGNGEE